MEALEQGGAAEKRQGTCPVLGAAETPHKQTCNQESARFQGRLERNWGRQQREGRDSEVGVTISPGEAGGERPYWGGAA